MSDYSLGEIVLCSQGILIYEAKIQDIKKEKGEFLYGIHYKGWNKSWDEYVPKSRLLKVTEENLKKQKQLQDELKKKKKPTVHKKTKKSDTESDGSSREGSKDRDKDVATKNVAVRLERLKKNSESGDYVGKENEEDSEEKPVIKSKTRTIKPVVAFKATEVPKSMKKKSKKDAEKDSQSQVKSNRTDKSTVVSTHQQPLTLSSRPKRDFGEEIIVNIPDGLKTVLVDDFDYIDRQRKLVNIPARYPVDDFINDYFTHMKQNCTAKETIAVEEVCRGLRDYFNCTLGSQLLYKFERVQYADVLKERQQGSSMSQLYSPVHLLRLLTRLGPMLSSVDINDDDLNKLLSDINHLVNYMEEKKDEIFLLEDYGTATPEYHRRAL